MYDFGNYKKRIKDIEEWLGNEFLGLQTGRATPAILDKVLVDAYGGKMAIRDVASITTEDARTLKISPWDASLGKAIEKGISSAELGLSVSVSDTGIRASFPALTAETRQSLLKLAGARLEDARVSLRKEREEVWQDIQKKEKQKEISEDEKFRLKDEMQELTDEANQKLDKLGEMKEKEIQG